MAVDTQGQYGGLLTTWNSYFEGVVSYSSTRFISLDMDVYDLSKKISLGNFYNPYLDHKTFWDNWGLFSVFEFHPLILRFDLKFITLIKYIWGLVSCIHWKNIFHISFRTKINRFRTYYSFPHMEESYI